MAYDPALSTPADQVRVLLGDTGSVPYWPDATINAMLALTSNVYLVAAVLAEQRAALSAAKTSITVDGLSVARSDETKAWLALGARLRAQGMVNGGVIGGAAIAGLPVVTGVSVSEMEAVDANTDRPESAFRMGMMSNPAAGSDVAR